MEKPGGERNLGPSDALKAGRTFGALGHISRIWAVFGPLVIGPLLRRIGLFAVITAVHDSSQKSILPRSMGTGRNSHAFSNPQMTETTRFVSVMGCLALRKEKT